MFGTTVAVAAVLGVCVLGGASVLGWARRRPAYRFDPMRLELAGSAPRWLTPEMARALFRSWRRVGGASFSLLDGAAVRDFLSRVERLSWVRSVQAEVRLPNEMELRLVLRRPVATCRDATGRPWLLDAEGVRLPTGRDAAANADLPTVVGARSVADVRAGARLVARVLEGLLPRVAELAALPQPVLPRLVAVDVENLGYRLSPGRAECELRFRGAQGAVADLAWGHPPGSPYREIPIDDKAEVLALLLHERPGLAGVACADLRFRRTWRDRLVLTEPGTP